MQAFCIGNYLSCLNKIKGENLTNLKNNSHLIVFPL